MKKLLFLLAFTLAGYAMVSQTTTQAVTTAIEKSTTTVASAGTAVASATEKVYNDGTAIVKEAYSVTKGLAPKVEEALKSIGTSLKVGANNVWDILVKQQLVWSLSILAALLLTLFTSYTFWKKLQAYDTNSEHEGRALAGLIVTGILMAIGMMLSGVNFQMMITGFVNPEFGAMQQVVEMAKSIK